MKHSRYRNLKILLNRQTIKQINEKHKREGLFSSYSIYLLPCDGALSAQSSTTNQTNLCNIKRL